MTNQKGLYARYFVPGPKAEAWLNTDAPMTFIVGPVGSAKTTTGAMKCLEVTRRQHPSTKDGVRRALIVAIRMNYRRMHDTLIPSYKKMFLEESKEMGIAGDGVYTGVKDGKLDHFFAWEDPVYGKCELTVKFRAFGDADIESFIRGFEPTAFWLNEVDELPEGCIGLLFQRAGRAYLDEKPDATEVPPAAYSRIFGDLNMPDEDSWFSRDILDDPPKGCEIYLQPSGFSPHAENLEILRREDPNYYFTKASQMEEWQVRRFIENKIGLTRHGKPVYPQYDDENTAQETLEPSPLIPLVIGVDQGLTPAAIVTQKDGMGRMLVLAEIVAPADEATGGEEFGNEVALYLKKHFRPWCTRSGFKFVFDPASKKKETDLKNFMKHFLTGVLEELRWAPGKLAPTNDPSARLGAVKNFLKIRAKRGGGPALLVHPRCTMIRRGFVSGYRLKKVKRTDGAVIYKMDKNEYSHPHDGLQYAAMEHAPPKLKKDEESGGKDADRRTPPPPAVYTPPQTQLDGEWP